MKLNLPIELRVDAPFEEEGDALHGDDEGLRVLGRGCPGGGEAVLPEEGAAPPVPQRLARRPRVALLTCGKTNKYALLASRSVSRDQLTCVLGGSVTLVFLH